MKVSDAKKLLQRSYTFQKNKLKKEGNYNVDSSLSGKRAQVYFNPDTQQAYVVHRGTASAKDIFTDIMMGVGYERGKRFQHGKKIQKMANEKYGKENVVTLGHSLGGRIAEKYGKGQIITLNKAATPHSIQKKVKANQIDIRDANDIVSALAILQKHKRNIITIPSSSINPFQSHKIENLDKLNEKNI